MFRRLGVQVGLFVLGLRLLGAGPALSQKGEPERRTEQLQGPPRAAYSVEDYKRDKDERSAVWFLNDEEFRKRVVEDAMWDIVKRWGTVIGIANVIALIGIYWWARRSVEQAVAVEAEKVVKARTDFVDQSVKSITSTAVTRVAEMQGELEKSKAALASTQEQIAATMQQADEVRTKSRELQRNLIDVSYAHQAIALSATFLNDPTNVQRAAAFIKLVSEDKNAKTITDLAAQIADLSERFRDLVWWVHKPYDNKTTLDEVLFRMRADRNTTEAGIRKWEEYEMWRRQGEEREAAETATKGPPK